jgi:hypothetical protein
VTSNKYLKYLGIPHEWDTFNCFTLIEHIYNRELNIEFSDVWTRLKESKNCLFTTIWYKKYNPILLQEIGNWIKISLQEVKEFDILVFKAKHKPDLILHFGMYIDLPNKYIHTEEYKSSCINELNQEARERLYGVFRHPKMV